MTTLPYAAVRGALEGVFNFALYNNLDLGLLSQVGSGIVSTSSQTYIITGTKIALKDLTPSIIQGAATSSIRQIIIKSGGWDTLMKKFVNSAGQLTWYNPIPPAAKT